MFFHGSRNGPDGVARERRKDKHIDTQKSWVLGDCVHSDGEFLGPHELSVDYVQLNREMGLLHTTKQGGRVILSWEASSVGEQSLGSKHPGKDDGRFLYTLSISVPEEGFVILLSITL